jgi:hypothetical protein
MGLGDGLVLMPVGVSASVAVQDLSEVLYWLSKQAMVHWLAPRPRLYYQNSAASRIIQVGRQQQLTSSKSWQHRLCCLQLLLG